MWEDPIVKEVREAGKQLAKEANYDLHLFFARMRKKEKTENRKVVSFASDSPLIKKK